MCVVEIRLVNIRCHDCVCACVCANFFVIDYDYHGLLCYSMDFIIGKRINFDPFKVNILIDTFRRSSVLHLSKCLLHCSCACDFRFFSVFCLPPHILFMQMANFRIFHSTNSIHLIELIAAITQNRSGAHTKNADPIYFDIAIFIEVHFSMPCAKYRMFEK